MGGVTQREDPYQVFEDLSFTVVVGGWSTSTARSPSRLSFVFVCLFFFVSAVVPRHEVHKSLDDPDGPYW